jgi:competence transcription factor ComK
MIIVAKVHQHLFFLKYIIIRDLQTMDKYHFIAQRWFAVEKDDGKVEFSNLISIELILSFTSCW